jgi:hypothetical protein
MSVETGRAPGLPFHSLTSVIFLVSVSVLSAWPFDADIGDSFRADPTRRDLTAFA